MKLSSLFVYIYNNLKNPILCFLATADYLFGDLGLAFNNNKKAQKYLKGFKSLLYNPRKRKIYSKVIGIKLFQTSRLKVISKSFINKEYRIWLFKRISDNRWQREKLVQLGLKKAINN